MMATEEPQVRVGQVWADNDKRCKGRTVTVLSFGTKVDRSGTVQKIANVCDSKGNHTTIRLDRFRPTSTGYRLISEPRTDGA